MIDLHCHILPALDDGAVDLADSVAMARQAFDDGIEVICATPHIRRDHEVAIGELAARVAEVDEKLASLGIDVRVVGGGEVAEAALAGLDASELDQVALGGGSWVLLEPAPGPLADSLRDAVDGLRRRGYRSLIAHPERHAAADTAERLADLVDRGALVQMTAGLIVDGPASAVMLELAGQGLVHVLGSDAHSSRPGSPFALSTGLERLWEVAALRDHVDWIARDAPTAILRGHPVEPPYPVTLGA